MYLYLVRHAQSQGNVLRTFHGHTDYPLTPLGREQARRVGEKLRAAAFSRCAASDLARAWETALSCVEGRGITPEPTRAMREQYMGALEGLTWEQAGERYPGFREAYVEDWFHTVPPGGESPRAMAARAAAWTEEVLRRGEDTLAVAHNGTLGLIMLHLKLVEETELLRPEWDFVQGSYTAIRVAGGKAALEGFNL